MNDKLQEEYCLELLDRLHVVMSNIDSHLLNHPLTQKHELVKAKIDMAFSELYDAYQIVGLMNYKK